MNEIIPIFKQQYKLDKVNFICLTDGEANRAWDRMVDDFNPERSVVHLPSRRTDLIFQDPITRKTYNISKMTKSLGRFYGDWAEKQVQFLLKLMKDRHGINTIGMFLINGRSVPRNVLEKYLGWFSMNRPKHQRARKECKEGGMVTVKSAGYDEYYIIPTGQNQIMQGLMPLEDGEAQDMTKGKLKTIFAKHQKGKTGNRYLINRMMDLIV
jgi:hypothetical protein